jgi:hypothetical protein
MAFSLLYFLSKKDPVGHTFSPIQKLLMKLELELQDTYGKTIFYTIYKISFSHKCHTEKSTVQVCISPSLFITLNKHTEQTSE